MLRSRAAPSSGGMGSTPTELMMTTEKTTIQPSSNSGGLRGRKRRRKRKRSDSIIIAILVFSIFASIVIIGWIKTSGALQVGNNKQGEDQTTTSNNNNLDVENEKKHIEQAFKHRSKFAQGGVGVLRLGKDGSGSKNDPNHSAGVSEVLEDARSEARKLGFVAPLPTEDTSHIDDDKDEVYDILKQAGISKDDLDIELRNALPTWSKVQNLYGTAPVIIGLDSCPRFQPQPDWSMAFFGIGGFFNTGTNLLAELLIQNCELSERMKLYGEKSKGMRWQVPWGKHTPIQYRTKHVTDTDVDVPLDNSFPMITIRDPYRWLGSMCRHTYSARWRHTEDNCPNLKLPNGKKNPVNVKYKEEPVIYDSLPELYNTWYNDFLSQDKYGDFPRVFVRFEDLMFYGKNVTETLCRCGGGQPRADHGGDFYHVGASAKMGVNAHGSDKTNLLQALIRYGHASTENRMKGLSREDLEAAKELFDPDLLNMFRYTHPI